MHGLEVRYTPLKCFTRISGTDKTVISHEGLFMIISQLKIIVFQPIINNMMPV